MASNNRGLAHILATVIVILIFLSTLISAFLSVGISAFGFRATDGSGDEEATSAVASGVLLTHAGISVTVAVLMGWLSYKMVKCEFNCA